MRPAAQTQTTVVMSAPATPANGCQRGIPGGMDIRRIINIGVHGGNSESRTEKRLLGCWTTTDIANIGMHNNSQTGIIRF